MRRFSSKLYGQSPGFTLIEMVMIVALLGILAVVAIPHFGDLTGDASQGAADGIAGAAAAASANNAAACKGGLATCNNAATGCNTGLIMDLPTGAVIGGSSPNCTVTYKGKTASYKAY